MQSDLKHLDVMEKDLQRAIRCILVVIKSKPTAMDVAKKTTGHSRKSSLELKENIPLVRKRSKENVHRLKGTELTQNMEIDKSQLYLGLDAAKKAPEGSTANLMAIAETYKRLQDDDMLLMKHQRDAQPWTLVAGVCTGFDEVNTPKVFKKNAWNEMNSLEMDLNR
jgi:hypothetical protein